MSLRKFDIRYDWRDGPVKRFNVGDELPGGLIVEDIGENYYLIRDLGSGDLNYYSKLGDCLSDDRYELDLDNKGTVDINNPEKFNEFLESVQKYYGRGNPVKLTIEVPISHFHHTIWLYKPELMIERLSDPQNKNTVIYRFFGEEILGEKVHYDEYLLDDKVTCVPTDPAVKFGISRKVKLHSGVRAYIIIESGNPME